jgi:outer membrane protein assembly factor BamE (lipoprotein component of BamABCDE complex)
MKAIFTMRGRRLMLLTALLGAVAAATWACSPMADTRGNLPLKEVVETIERGKQNRDQVAAMLGTPSTTTAFGKQETWYYIGKRTETLVFFKPTLLERKILVIKFDAQGRVDKVASFDATDGKPVAPVARVTPTKGKQLGVLEQIIGNVGRFSNAQDEP